MPTNLSGRFTLILVLALLWLAAIFWPVVGQPSLAFNPNVPLGQKINLKPGIDMVGGTSLLYEIKVPQGTTASEQLVEEVMGALKRRVDPDGTRNLIWRPQGATRLEIQMPLSQGSGDADLRRAELIKVRDALEATNVAPAAVVNAVEQKAGGTRAQLDALAMGSPARKALFDELVKTFDATEAARAAKDAAREAELRNRYEDLKAQIEQTNVRVADLEEVLGSTTEKPAERARRLAAVTNPVLTLPPPVSPEGGAATTRPTTLPSGQWPTRQAPIDAYVKAFDAFQKVRNQIDDTADLKRLLRGSGVLEFHILADDASPAEVAAMEQRLRTEGPRSRAGDQLKWFEVDNVEQFKRPTIAYGDKQYVLAWITPEKSLDSRQGRQGWGLERAYKTQGQMGDWVVGFTFDPVGGRYFGDLTKDNVNRPLAIMLDGRVISAPNINTPITGGSGIIEGGQGGFPPKELNYLVRTLSAGSLPAQLSEDPISERTVGPQLGQDNLKRGLFACAFGLVVVAVFLIGYYYVSGVVAMIAVLLNMVFILGSMAAFDATFTLPSVAGIVLTIGMAVDANVLIFERLREEQVRGLSLRMALRNAYDRAFSAILDGNVTTGITALVLYWFGSEEVKGFGITLLIGIVSSLFTALFVTKTIFAWLIERGWVERLGSLPLTFPKWDRMLRPNIDWMGKAWAFYAFSGLFIAVGLVLFGIKLKQGQMLDIEFAKGTSVQFELREPMEIDDLRNLVDAESRRSPEALPAPQVVSVGTDRKTYEVVTPNENANPVREAVLRAVGQERLNIAVASKFDRANASYDEASDAGVIVPIKTADQEIAGVVPAELPKHVGGAAIVLKDMDPPLDDKTIEDRIQRQRLSVQTGGTAGAANPSIDVHRVPGTRTAIVMISDPDFAYAEGDDLRLQQWRDELVAPIWRIANDAITKPPSLQRVTNFDAQVAGDTQRAAFIALTISILIIMAYIWVRFGNLKYGTATVVALLHDTLFVVAAIGFSHYLAEVGVFRDALLIEPFRINLTLVAAILTVMGYSMNDTVVVFDRIRENRGKFGHVSRQIVNDSINQTLSRTLLTGGTTIVTIFVMYIWGGSGIHGFTFALLVGIVVGTYSSIAIASPILLLGAGREAQATTGAARARPVGQLQRAGA